MPKRLSATWWKDHGAESPDDAVRRLVGRLSPVDIETVALDEAAGRVLAQQINADRPSPPIDVSAMDGFALRASDLTDTPIPVKGEALVGRKPPAITPGAATRIVTGAAIPDGADLVIKREDVEDHDDSITILASASPSRGDHIRRQGENLGAGEPAIAPGCTISPTVAGALATFGRTSVDVFRRVRVGVVATGDEVVDASQSPTPYQVRDSHAPALRAMLGTVAWIDMVAAGRVGDDPDALTQTVSNLLPRVDALLLTAGVSVGPRDLVPTVLQSLGVETLFRGVAQRPGRPTLGAVGPQGQLVMGLPGNPLSVFVATRRIAALALAHRAGLSPDALAPTLVAIDNPDDATLPLHWHRPVRLIASPAPGVAPTATLIPVTGSHDVPAAARSTGFISLPPDTPAHATHPYHPWTLI